jgi:hypothetical protein
MVMNEDRSPRKTPFSLAMASLFVTTGALGCSESHPPSVEPTRDASVATDAVAVYDASSPVDAGSPADAAVVADAALAAIDAYAVDASAWEDPDAPDAYPWGIRG